MQKNRTNALQRLVGAMLAAACFSTPVYAEQDVLERNAPIWKDNRFQGLVVTALGKQGEKTVAVGERGLILISESAGAGWRQVKSPVTVTLTGVSFSDAETVWIVGHGGVLLKSTDGGVNWGKQLDGKKIAALVLEAASQPGADPRFLDEANRLVADGPDKPLLGVQFFDKNSGLIVGAYGLILGTRDGGATWTPLQQRTENTKGAHLYAVLKSAAEIWIAGEQGSLFVSNDAGEKFKSVNSPYQGTYFGIAEAGNNLVAFGMRGNAFYSSDRGISWNKSSIATSNSLTAGYTRKNGELVLVDDGGNVFESSDGGISFLRAPVKKMPPLTSVIEVSDGQLLFGGARGIANSGKQEQLSSEIKK